MISSIIQTMSCSGWHQHCRFQGHQISLSNQCIWWRSCWVLSINIQQTILIMNNIKLERLSDLLNPTSKNISLVITGKSTRWKHLPAKYETKSLLFYHLQILYFILSVMVRVVRVCPSESQSYICANGHLLNYNKCSMFISYQYQ